MPFLQAKTDKNAPKNAASSLALKTTRLGRGKVSMKKEKAVNFNPIETAIQAATAGSFRLESSAPVGGGSINQAYRLSGIDVETKEVKEYFLKLNRAAQLPMFEAEAAGLKEMAQSNSIRVPGVICSGTCNGQSYLVLEALDFSTGSSGSAEQLGQQLAAMHHYTSDRFGWYMDNTIGSTPQPNQQSDDWVNFWQQHRLGFQLRLAGQNGASRSLLEKGDQLMDALPHFFMDYQPKASLLHGDLWSGNYAFLKSGEPVIFDPAVYYGDREADIAMTELFGGFPQAFYAAYNEAWPLDPGYTQRKKLYNLYHILNHFNLFGGGYAQQAESMIEQLLSF